MIIYTTKLMRERYKIKMPEEYVLNKDVVEAILNKDGGDRMHEWGAKLFYFDKRKCIQLCHFASKLTIYLCDIKVGDLANVGTYLSMYLYDLYSDDELVINLMDRLFNETPVVCFSKLTDRSIISTLNRTQIDFAWDGYLFYDYIENGILKGRDINRRVNEAYIQSQRINGKTYYFCAKKYFRQLLLERYGYTAESAFIRSR